MYQISGLVQERRNSTVLAVDVFLALSHRYKTNRILSECPQDAVDSLRFGTEVESSRQGGKHL